MAANPVTYAETTNVGCDSCGKMFAKEDEVFQSTIRYVVRGGTALDQRHVMEDNGDLRFAPLVFHLTCWEEIVTGLEKALADVPPVEDEEAVLLCTFCESGVREWEHFARVPIGELKLSPRSPDGEPIWRFRRVDKNAGALLCLSCIGTVHDEVLEIWDDVSQEGECFDCAKDRCWRDGECDCVCHEEEEDD